jgi:hypothetical protein
MDGELVPRDKAERSGAGGWAACWTQSSRPVSQDTTFNLYVSTRGLEGGTDCEEVSGGPEVDCQTRLDESKIISCGTKCGLDAQGRTNG